MSGQSSPHNTGHKSGSGLPLYMQVLLILGWPFGFRRVSGRQVVAVYRWGRFNRLAGPRTYRLGLFEYTRKIVNIAPTHVSIHIPNLMTSDGLMYEVALELQFQFDPRKAPKGDEMKAIRRCELPGGTIEIVQTNAQLVLQNIFSQYKAELITRGEVRARIQLVFLESLKRKLGEYALVLIPRDCYIREWKPPASLIESMEEAARRLVDVQNLSLLTGEEFSREVRMKAVEALKHMIHGMPQLNLDALVQDNNLQARDAAREAVQRIIESQARQISPGISTQQLDASAPSTIGRSDAEPPSSTIDADESRL